MQLLSQLLCVALLSITLVSFTLLYSTLLYLFYLPYLTYATGEVFKIWNHGKPSQIYAKQHNQSNLRTAIGNLLKNPRCNSNTIYKQNEKQLPKPQHCGLAIVLPNTSLVLGEACGGQMYPEHFTTADRKLRIRRSKHNRIPRFPSHERRATGDEQRVRGRRKRRQPINISTWDPPL